jgi:hypothetical protein
VKDGENLALSSIVVPVNNDFTGAALQDYLR